MGEIENKERVRLKQDQDPGVQILSTAAPFLVWCQHVSCNGLGQLFDLDICSSYGFSKHFWHSWYPQYPESSVKLSSHPCSFMLFSRAACTVMLLPCTSWSPRTSFELLLEALTTFAFCISEKSAPHGQCQCQGQPPAWAVAKSPLSLAAVASKDLGWCM